MNERRVEVAGRMIWTARAGAGPPLLLLPGMMAHHGYWRPPFLAALQASHELIAMDPRGTGASDRAREPFTIGELADDAAAVLDALEVERAAALGFSMGGAVALELGLRQPQRVERLVLAAPAVALDGPALEPGARERILAALRSGDMERSLRATWEESVSGDFADDEAAWADWTRASTQYRMSLRTIEHQLAALDAYHAGERVDALEAPALVVYGDRDRLVAPATAQALAARLSRAQLHTFAGAGHLFFWERPDEAAGAIASWTAQPARAGGGG